MYVSKGMYRSLCLFSVFDLNALRLRNNQITHIPPDAFHFLYFSRTSHNIPVLDLSENNLQSIDRHAFRGIRGQLSKIYFRNCSLTVFPVEPSMWLRSLKEISISTNRITAIPDGTFIGYPELDGLVIDKNPIRNPNREGLLSGVETTLAFLSLEDVGLTTFPSKLIKNLKKIHWVNLSDNDIKFLNDDTFKGFQTTMPLQVTLEKNKIYHIARHVLRGTTIKLHQLDLSYNQLHSFDFIDPCLPAFQYNWTDVPPQVYIKHNHLNCDCDLLNLVNQQYVMITGTCAQPPQYHGMTLNASRLHSYNETGELNCPRTDPIDCTSDCDCLMTSSLLTVAYVTIVYVTVQWMA